VKTVSHNQDVCIDVVFHQYACECDEFDVQVERKPFGILGIDMSVVFQSLNNKRDTVRKWRDSQEREERNEKRKRFEASKIVHNPIYSLWERQIDIMAEAQFVIYFYFLIFYFTACHALIFFILSTLNKT
jgi:hypothetical protein